MLFIATHIHPDSDKLLLPPISQTTQGIGIFMWPTTGRTKERGGGEGARFDIQLVVVSHVSEVRTQGRLGAASSAAWGTLHEDEDTERKLTCDLFVFY